tara:strand:+ start:206 stop:433 length:228 start_codon:yes stop_codon:yes gene_type:complete
MGSIFTPKMPPLPPVQAPPPIPEPTVSAEEKERLAQERAAVDRKRRGRKSTILTGALMPEAEEAAKAEKTLLGDA